MGEAVDPVPAGHQSRWRVPLLATAVVIVVAASAAIAYRVLAPAEVVTEATRGYPATARALPGVIGTLAAAPLIVDGRLRVYATKRQIRADAPVDAPTQRSPFWSYRRWPEHVVGVVAVGTTVVGRWSDGQLVAIDARTGRVAWRTGAPVPATAGYTGRRTGAATVYAPVGLYTAGRVLIAHGVAETLAVDATDGRVLWRLPADRDCTGTAFTTVAARFVVFERCAGAPEVAIYDVSSGRLVGRWQGWTVPPAGVTPLGCRLGRSECAGMRTIPERDGSAGSDGAARGWLLRGPSPVPAPTLDPVDAWLIAAPGHGDLAVGPAGDGRLVARRADTGDQVWSQPSGPAPARAPARVIAVQPGRVHLLTAGYWLVTLDGGTGRELSSFRFTHGRERTGWAAGHAYAEQGFVLVERLAAEADPAAADDEYYFIAQPVLLAGT